MAKLKGNDELCGQLISLVQGKGLSIKAACEQLGVAPRSGQEFFAKSKKWMQDWWEENSKNVDDYFKGFLNSSGEGFFYRYDSKLPTKYLEDVDDPVFVAYNRAMCNLKTIKIIVIADTQCKPSESLDYLEWIGVS